MSATELMKSALRQLVNGEGRVQNHRFSSKNQRIHLERAILSFDTVERPWSVGAGRLCRGAQRLKTPCRPNSGFQFDPSIDRRRARVGRPSGDEFRLDTVLGIGEPRGNGAAVRKPRVCLHCPHSGRYVYGRGSADASSNHQPATRSVCLRRRRCHLQRRRQWHSTLELISHALWFPRGPNQRSNPGR